MFSSKHTLVVTALAVLLGPSADGQTPFADRPDFSGIWLPNAAGNDAELPPLGGELSIEHDGMSFSLTLHGQRLTERLDAPQTLSPLRTASGEIWSQTVEPRWIGGALLLSIRTTGSIGSWEDGLILSLDGEGLLNVVSIATPKTRPGGRPTMNTRLDKYRRK